MNFIGSMLLFYYSGLFEWSLRSPVGHLAMVVHFTAAGYLFVNALVGIDPGPRRLPYPQRLLLLFATMVFHAFFGVTLVTGDVAARRRLVRAHGSPLGCRPRSPTSRPAARSPGASARSRPSPWPIGVALAWSRDDDRTARRRDRQVDRDGDVELDEYNAMLADLADRDTHPPA